MGLAGPSVTGEAETCAPHGVNQSPTTTEGSRPTPGTREGPPADPADIRLAATKHDALDTDQKARLSQWLREAHEAGGPFGLGGTGNQTTRRLALVEASIAIAQEGFDDDGYRALIAIAGHSPDSFTAPIGALLAEMNAMKAQRLYQAIRHAARDKEN